jgi:hypothetical protein
MKKTLEYQGLPVPVAFEIAVMASAITSRAQSELKWTL